MRRIALVTLVVDDYDEAIRFYTEALGFRLAEDEPRPDGSRWVVVEPAAEGGGGLLLARAKNESQRARVGDQTGGAWASSSTPTISPATTPGCVPPA